MIYIKTILTCIQIFCVFGFSSDSTKYKHISIKLFIRKTNKFQIKRCIVSLRAELQMIDHMSKFIS